MTSPSLCSCGIFLLAFCGRWQPKQLGFHDEWQAMQLMLLVGVGAGVLRRPGTSPQTIWSLSNRTVLARCGLLVVVRRCAG